MAYELTDLKIFAAVAAVQNLSAGAAELFLSPSSASTRIKKLEQDLGVTLFVRTQQGMRLSAAGEQAEETVREILRQSDLLRSHMRERLVEERGRLRIGMEHSVRQRLIAPALSGLITRFPNVDVELWNADTDELSADLLGGRADAGVFPSPVDHAGLSGSGFADDDLVLVCPPGHPLRHRSSVPFVEALRHDLIEVDPPAAERRITPVGHADAPRIRLRGSRTDSALALVAQGLGVAVLPSGAVAEGAAVDGLCTVPLRDTWAKRELHLVVPTRPQEPPFVAWLRSRLLRDRQGVVSTSLTG